MKVYDASAVLAILYGETGADVARASLAGGVISLANVAEVIGDMIIGGGRPENAVKSLRNLGLIWLEPDEAQAVRAAEMRALKGLSLGDRFCIALAEARNLPVVTADRVWANHGLRVSVELIR